MALKLIKFSSRSELALLVVTSYPKNASQPEFTYLLQDT